MAKGIGLIGNFKGKVGNMVGYKLSDSNTGNSQGIRVYQPIVKNPKTSAQAEQRAKLAPINATYRALKMIIDRGNEGLPYGNKSRLAWLKQAFKAENMPWIMKGEVVEYPVICQITKGSLTGMEYRPNTDGVEVVLNSIAESISIATIGELSQAFKADYPSLKEGDQITFVFVGGTNGVLSSAVYSFVIDSTSTTPVSDVLKNIHVNNGYILVEGGIADGASAVIVSRQGDNGEHLRSNVFLEAEDEITDAAPYDAASKTAAIASYMNSAAANSDWAEESIQ
jgi:hypothetical protein